ncbi:CBS domain-containing protein, partial [Pantoea agglomerans]|uniref:CBS domain-containing protein n=1 Tax=Enterobacter agglomerans TaxID=549 RepID=UPI001A8D8D6D
VPADTSLSDLLSHVAQAPCAVPVVGEENQYVGIISKSTLLESVCRYHFQKHAIARVRS